MIDVCANLFEFWPFKNFIMLLLQGVVHNLRGFERRNKKEEENNKSLLITFIMNLYNIFRLFLFRT